MAEQTFLIHTDADGSLVFLHDDCLQFLYEHGTVQITRNADVEPDINAQWWVDLGRSGIYKHLGPFQTRAEALQAERNFLEREVLP